MFHFRPFGNTPTGWKNALESRVGVLPEEYIDFVQIYNGGWMNDSLSYYIDHGESVSIMLSCLYGVGVDEDIFNKLDIYSGRVPSYFLPLGRDVGGNLICLDLSPDNYGKVWFWDHEEEYDELYDVNDTVDSYRGNLYFVSDNFNDFFNNIKENDIVVDSESHGEVVWTDPEFDAEMKRIGNMD